jgi:hypothetical protein
LFVVLLNLQKNALSNTEEIPMNTPTPHGCLLIFRGSEWYKGLSPDEMQEIATRWKAWFDRLKSEGKAIAGNPLEHQGKVISGKNGRTVVDGPFAESKEAVGGYFLLTVRTLEEAVAIAQECPGLPYGAVVEARPIAPDCPMSEEARMTLWAPSARKRSL